LKEGKQMPHRASQHWILVAATFLVIFLGMGCCYYTLPVYYPIFVKEFHWNKAQIGLAASVILFLAALNGPIVGRIADRWGPRVSILNGVLFTAIAMAGMSRMHGLLQFYVFCAFLGLGVSSYSIMVMQMLMARWFIRHRGLATGIVIAGMGLGGSVGPLVISPFLAVQGWRTVLLWQASGLICIAVPTVLWIIRDDPRERGRSPEGVSDANPTAAAINDTGLTFSEAVRSANFWYVAGGAFCGMFTGNSVIQHVVLYMRELHFEQNVAAGALSLLLFASVAGRAGFGLLSDMLTRRRTLILSYVILLIGVCLLLTSLNRPGLIFMVLLVGVGYGGSVVMMTLTAAEVFGIQHLGSILGVIMVLFNAGGSIGPALTGMLADRAGYHIGFLGPAIAALVAVFCGISIRLPLAHCQEAGLLHAQTADRTLR